MVLLLHLTRSSFSAEYMLWSSSIRNDRNILTSSEVTMSEMGTICERMMKKEKKDRKPVVVGSSGKRRYQELECVALQMPA